MRFEPRFAIVALVATLTCASCNAAGPPTGSLPVAAAPTPVPPMVSSYIKHIVIVVQENRSFENLFAGWPGADAPMYGYLHTGRRVKLHSMTFEQDQDMGHLFETSLASWNHGKMNGFDLNRFGTLGNGAIVGAYPYAYVDHAEIDPYRVMAARYVLADRMFPTEFGTSFTSHQDLLAGTTQIDANHSLVDTPATVPWGCDAPAGTTTFLVDRLRKIEPNGPFPCFTQYATIADTLDGAHVSWKYYVGWLGIFAGEVWDGFDAIKNVRYGPDWTRNVIHPETLALTDPAAGHLPSVEWVIPDLAWSDHPAVALDWGPSWVADVVDAVGESKYWKSTAIIVLWDDWGGWYDDVPPPQLDYVGLGVRVPLLVISPYAKKGYVSHTQYEYGSILKFIEQAYNLPSLHATDVRANSLLDAFDFTQPPRAFVPIHAKYPAKFFLTQRGPGITGAPDTDDR
jgi:phospholipase C